MKTAMDKFKKMLFSVALFAVLTLVSCEDKVDQGIIGKWEMVEKGYYDFNDSLIMKTVPAEHRGGYIEFKPNNQKIVYRYRDGYIDTDEYKVKDDKIYVNYKNKEITDVDTYKLSENNNKLRLEYFSGIELFIYPNYKIRVYKRMK